jgi:hypothetical protein
MGANFFLAHKLFKRRMSVALAHPDLRTTADLLNNLGFEGMSGDKSDEDVDGLPLPLEALSHPWRSPVVTVLLRTLDDLFVHDKVTANDEANLPKVRHRSANQLRGSVPVPGLPRNFYNSTWLNNLSSTIELQVQPSVSFAHSDAIKRCVSFIFPSLSKVTDPQAAGRLPLGGNGPDGTVSPNL